MTAPDNRDVAIHEAGHAVAAHLVGLRIGSVTIEPGEDDAGHTVAHDDDHLEVAAVFAPGAPRPYPALSDRQRWILERDIVQRVGGLCADFIHAGDPDEAGAEDDILAANVIALCLVPREEIGAFIQVLVDRTAQLLRHHFDAVYDVAELLDERRTITGAEALSAIEHALKREP